MAEISGSRTSETGDGRLMAILQAFEQFHNLAIKIAKFDPEIPDREPDRSIHQIKIWDLGKGYKLHLLSDGTKEWILNRERHRKDGPAIEYPDGSKFWYLNGQRHREDGPAIELADGSKSWWLNGKQHRKNGPAVERPDGSKNWYFNDRLHREDGPAVEYPDGSVEYWLNGKQIRTKSKDYDSPQFQKRWQKLLDLERVRQVMED